MFQVFAQRCSLHCNVDDALLVETKNDTALQWVSGVIEVHNGALCTLQTFVCALQQIFTALHQHLNGDIIGNEILLNQQANKIKIWLRSRRETNFNFLEAHFHECVEHAQFALGVHWVDKGLIAIAKIDRTPQRCLRGHVVRPGAVLQHHRNERCVFFEWHLFWNYGLWGHVAFLSR